MDQGAHVRYRLPLAKVGEKLVIYGEDSLQVTVLLTVGVLSCSLVWSFAVDSLNVMLAGALFAVATAAPLIGWGIGKVLGPDRYINGEYYHAELYAAVTDALRSRGIRDTQQYILSHPDFALCAKELARELDRDQLYYPSATSLFQALVYSRDMDPRLTKEAVITIVNERGVADPDEAKTMLTDFLETETAIRAGML